MSRTRSVGLSLAALLVVGCTNATELVVTVTVAPDLPRIAMAVAEVRGESDAWIDGPHGFVVAPGGSSFAVVPRGGDASRVVRVVVVGCLTRPLDGAHCPAGDVVATQSFRSSFLPGRVVRIAVELSGRCSDVECAVDEICQPSMGECAPLRPDGCTSDADCSASVACAVPRCAAGVCVQRPDSALCGADEVCSPELGCVAPSPADTGMDARPNPDSGIDASREADVGSDARASVDADRDAAAGSPDAARDAGWDTRSDATTPTCDALYGGSPGYMLCAERADECEFRASPLDQ